MFRLSRLRVVEIGVALLLTLAALVFVGLAVWAVEQFDIRVMDAWARPTVGQGTSTAAYMTIVNGGTADTMYGPMQVQISVRGGRIVSSHAIVYPQGSGRDQQINSYAIPQLDQETVQAQSAQIDTVSGATFTPDGYRRSLQSAIDAAHQAGGL